MCLCLLCCCVVLCVGLSKGLTVFHEARCVGTSEVVLLSPTFKRMKTRGVHSRKAYLWEFEYLVCIYLREQQWATKNPRLSKSVIFSRVYLLFDMYS